MSSNAEMQLGKTLIFALTKNIYSRKIVYSNPSKSGRKQDTEITEIPITLELCFSFVPIPILCPEVLCLVAASLLVQYK